MDQLLGERPVLSVAFSPDGSRIVSASSDKTIRLWDTVAVSDRVAQRNEALHARETMNPFIDELFSEGLDFSAVAGRVRDDASLSEPLRRAALNLVLKRCSQMREQVREQAREAHQQAQDHFDQNQYDDAEPLLSAALEAVRRWLPPDSPEAVPLIEDLADLYNRQGRLDEARPYAMELISIRRRATAEQVSNRKRIAERQDASARDLNAYAWLLLTCKPSDLRDPKAALTVAVRVNEMTGHESSTYLDTLSLAYHLTGDTAKAAENQKLAIALLPEGPSSLRVSLEAALGKFEMALANSETLPTEQDAVASDPPADEKQEE